MRIEGGKRRVTSSEPTQPSSAASAIATEALAGPEVANISRAVELHRYEAAWLHGAAAQDGSVTAASAVINSLARAGLLRVMAGDVRVHEATLTDDVRATLHPLEAAVLVSPDNDPKDHSRRERFAKARDEQLAAMMTAMLLSRELADSEAMADHVKSLVARKLAVVTRGRAPHPALWLACIAALGFMAWHMLAVAVVAAGVFVLAFRLAPHVEATPLGRASLGAFARANAAAVADFSTSPRVVAVDDDFLEDDDDGGPGPSAAAVHTPTPR